MQDTDFRWFIDNYENIFKEYGNVYVVVKNQKIIGTYSSYAEGVKKTLLTEDDGSFIVQECNGDISGYTDYIASTNFM